MDFLNTTIIMCELCNLEPRTLPVSIQLLLLPIQQLSSPSASAKGWIEGNIREQWRSYLIGELPKVNCRIHHVLKVLGAICLRWLKYASLSLIHLSLVDLKNYCARILALHLKKSRVNWDAICHQSLRKVSLTFTSLAMLLDIQRKLQRQISSQSALQFWTPTWMWYILLL